MSQFRVHANANAATRASYPFLLDIQSPLLESLDTRIVIPLAPLSRYGGAPIRNLTPTVEIGGEPYIVLCPQMAGVHKNQLGEVMLDLSERRKEIVKAIDFLITGF
jgi:toxin CcdB